MSSYDLAHWARPGMLLIARDRPAKICGHPAKPGSLFCPSCKTLDVVQAYMKARALRSRVKCPTWEQFKQQWEKEHDANRT